MIQKPSFASFWAGPPLSPYERACIGSFVARGYSVTLYSFEPCEGAPPGVVLEDAARITPRTDLERFIYGGRPDIAHFSDFFRYRLFAATDHIWIDTDILLLRPFDIPLERSILTRETEDSICNAVMRLDRQELDLAPLIDGALALAGKPLRWGATGPLLLTSVYKGSPVFERAYEPKYFYPVLYDVFWKVFLPEYEEECRELCRDAYTLHLWNNIVVQLGVWKELAPPAGSYLHRGLLESDALGSFEGTYPAEIMRRMIENWRLRFSGGDVGIGNLIRQLGRGSLRTARRRGWLAPGRPSRVSTKALPR